MIPVTLDRYLDPNLSRNNGNGLLIQMSINGLCAKPVYPESRSSLRMSSERLLGNLKYAMTPCCYDNFGELTLSLRLTNKDLIVFECKFLSRGQKEYFLSHQRVKIVY